MNRFELQEYVEKAVSEHKDWVYMLIYGSPDAARQHLLGPRMGPKGWVVGHKAPDNLVRFSSTLLQEYLDELPVDEFQWDESVGCEIAPDEIVNSFSRFHI